METDSIRIFIQKFIVDMGAHELKFSSYLRIISEIIKRIKYRKGTPDDYSSIVISIMSHKDMSNILDQSDIDFIILLASDKEMIRLLTDLLDWITDARSMCLPILHRWRHR